MSLIEIKDLSYSYNETNKAVDGVSLKIEKGSYTTVIGHNGSGKSTLAKLIAGLLPIKQGEVIINGLQMNEANLPEIRKELGIVFQNPDNQFIGSTVKDDIAFGLENKRVKSEDMEAIIEEYADKVGLSAFLDHEPQNLSGGQKQRVAIAGILAMHPDIIIFDEATSMLD
ncbi:MAG: ATP-binding cassette domain-containing protein, partial [Erysipelotrichaceae bacterium]|nr:ATP-binding cassette domain-containing protein [Erysipelotrichaceae bacterium]